MISFSDLIEQIVKARLSYSLEGEDILLDYYFGGKKDGFYVDVGAHHPTRFSNTYRFYKKGWRGINIDAKPGSMKLFDVMRPRDINLEIGISQKPKRLTYYDFEVSPLNTFDKTLALSYQNRGYVLLGKKTLKTNTLSNVLAKHIPKGVVIDFMSVDVEGLDYEVINSNDWSIFRPVYLIVEAPELDMLNLNNSVRSKIVKYMKGKGYSFVSKTINSFFFRDNLKK